MSDAPAGWRREDIAANLASFRRIALYRPDLKQASVAVCLMSSPVATSRC